MFGSSVRRQVGILLFFLGLSAAPAAFADSITFSPGAVSFTGSLPDGSSGVPQNEAALLSFTLAGPSDISIQTYGYGGGTNAAGQPVSGGFIPVIELYDPAGNLIEDSLQLGFNGCPPAGVDSLDACGDVFVDLGPVVDAGNYTLAVLAFGNGPNGTTLADGFLGDGAFQGNDGSTRENFYAVDVTGDVATPLAATPEPSSLALLATGICALGLRRKKSLVSDRQ